MNHLKLPFSFLFDNVSLGLLPSDTKFFFIQLVAISSRDNLKGKLPDNKKIAFICRMTVKAVGELINILKNEGVVQESEAGDYQITHFDETQGLEEPPPLPKKSNGAIRSKRYREKRKREKAGDPTNDMA